MDERSGSGLSIAFDRTAPSSSSSSSRNTRRSASTSQRPLGAFGQDDSGEEQQHRSGSSSTHRYRTEVRSRRSSPSPPPRSKRVIPVSGGSDWREDRRRRIALAAAASVVGGDPSNSKNHQTTAGPDQINTENQRQGLQVRVQTGGRSRLEEEREELERLRVVKTPPLSSAAPSPPPHEVPLTDDELARRALLSGQGINDNGRNTNRSIPLLQQISEEDALKADTSSRPDAPTLEDYTATPVEDFGMAILRGMGWKEEDHKKEDGKAKGEVKKRSALLGLGATEPTSIPGASGSGSGQTNGSGPTKRPDGRGYKPLVRRRKEDADDGESRSSSAAPPTTRRRSRSPPSRRDDERTCSSSDNHGSRRRHREDERERDRHRSDRHRDHYDDESEEEARRRRRRREEERDREDRRRHESSSRRESRR